MFFLLDGEELPKAPAVVQAAFRQGVSTLLPLHALTLVVIERYMYICRPLYYEVNFSTKRVKSLLIALVMLMILWTSVVALNVQLNTGLEQLSYSFQTGWNKKAITGTAIAMFLYVFLPLVIQVYCFGSITRAAWNHRRRIQDSVLHGMSGQSGGGPLTYLMMTSTVLRSVAGVARLCGVYWITWFPLLILLNVKFMLELRQEEDDDVSLSPTFQLLYRYSIMMIMTVVPVINPLVCLRSMLDLRQKWRKMMRLKSASASLVTSSTS